MRARRIAGGLVVIAPGGRECAIAYALSDLVAGDIQMALERISPLAGAGDPFGLAFQALALGAAGRFSERDAVLRSVPRDDPALDRLVAALLTEE